MGQIKLWSSWGLDDDNDNEDDDDDKVLKVVYSGLAGDLFDMR